ncbi:hypothetical protein [Streptomyces sp. NPDC005209]|uniref:hypothetical protein n=1 Tax=Streptomyces sp. NPDC005209 TaxID=3156715 RepID=UPI0033AD57C5
MDLIVFTAVLITGVLLIAIGVSANALATISVALSGLYGAWTGTTRQTGPRADPRPDRHVAAREDDIP